MPRSSIAALAASLSLLLAAPLVHGDRQAGADRLTADTFRGLALRPLGPSLVTGRVGDIAIDPRNPSIWYIAVASGGVWKTVNRGTTWTPIFDDYGAYSMGCITIDPKDSNVLWLGTGENQSQRSVGFGDGVYKSTDPGRTWSNVGLRLSRSTSPGSSSTRAPRTSSGSRRRDRCGRRSSRDDSSRRRWTLP